MAAVFFLLMAGLGTSMAQARNDCPDGTLAGGTYEDLEISGGGDCYIMNVLVTGDINAWGMDQISMAGSTVNGSITITNSVSAFIYNTVVNGSGITSWRNTNATVVRNTVYSGNIDVSDETGKQQTSANVEENSIYGGLLEVNCLERATVRNNLVRDGFIACINNDHLDSFNNDARGNGSSVNCHNGIGD